VFVETYNIYTANTNDLIIYI